MLNTGCIKRANDIIKQETLLPGPGIYIIEIDDSQNPYPTIRIEVQQFMQSILANNSNCIEQKNASQPADYIIQVRYKNTPGCGNLGLSSNSNKVAEHSLEIQVIKASEKKVLYKGITQQKCTPQKFRESLKSMLTGLIKKDSTNEGRQMTLHSSFDYSDR